MKRILVLLITIAGCIISFGFIYSETKFIDTLVEKLEKYNELFPEEEINVHIDRDIYRPGDYILFKANVLDATNNFPTERSNDLFIRLVDIYGNKWHEERYPLINGNAYGYIRLPEDINLGKYTFLAYTGWMKNMSIEKAFSKDVIVYPVSYTNKSLGITFNKKVYKQGSRVIATIEKSSIKGGSNKQETLNYSIISNNKVLSKGRIVIECDKKSIVTYDIPKEFNTDIIGLKVEYKDKCIYKMIPFVKTLNVDVFPECGSLIEGLNSKMVLKFTDQNSLPVNVNGILYDKEGAKISETKEVKNGISEITFVPERSSEYYIEVPEINDQKYIIPEVKKEGVIIHSDGIENGFLKLFISSKASKREDGIVVVATSKNSLVWAANIVVANNKMISIPCKDINTDYISITVFDNNGTELAQRPVLINSSQSNIIINENDLESSEKIEMIINVPENENNAANISLSIVNSDFLPILCNSGKGLTDNQLLSDGKYQCDWNTIFQPEMDKYIPHNGISGTITKNNGEPAKNAAIRITNILAWISSDFVSDENGKFSYSYGDRRIREEFLTITAFSKESNEGLMIDVDNSYEERLLDYLKMNEEQWNMQKCIYADFYKVPDLLNNKYKANTKPINYSEKMKYDPNKYSSYTSVLDIIKSMKNIQVAQNQIIFPGGVNSFQEVDGALFVIDDTKAGTDIDILSTITPSEIINVNIYTEPVDIQSYTSYNTQGVIVIETIRGIRNDKKHNNNIVTIDPDELINSDDLIKSQNGVLLYWNPEIIVDESGNYKIEIQKPNEYINATIVFMGYDNNSRYISENKELIFSE